MGTSLAALAAPSAAPVASAAPLEQAPLMDGDVLNDAAWRKAQAITGFWQIQPNDGQAASQRTEVFIGYTEQMLYVAVICYDKDPNQIIVTDSRRDSSLDESDSFQFILDGFNDRQNGLIFGTNPAGLEYDAQVTKEGTSNFGFGGGEFNLNWDTSWQVETSITAEGWQAEFAIPFKSLRYGGGKDQTWGINFQRNIRRNNEISFWAPLGRQYNINRVSDAGTITDLQPPHQKSLKLTPYGVAKRNEGNRIANGTGYETGFDLKYSLTPSLTLDVTYNTDFAQVESDEFQVNLDRFSLFLPEQRPFFLENAGQFSVGISHRQNSFLADALALVQTARSCPLMVAFASPEKSARKPMSVCCI